MKQLTHLLMTVTTLSLSKNSIAQNSVSIPESAPSIQASPRATSNPLMTVPTAVTAVSVSVTPHSTEFDLTKCYDTAHSADDLRLCAQKDFDIVDNKMVTTSKTLMTQIQSKKIGPSTETTDPVNETVRRLEAAEKSWYIYRESQCDFEGTVLLGDPAEAIVIIGCMSRLTKERTQLLEHSLAKEPEFAP